MYFLVKIPSVFVTSKLINMHSNDIKCQTPRKDAGKHAVMSISIRILSGLVRMRNIKKFTDDFDDCLALDKSSVSEFSFISAPSNLIRCSDYLFN